MKMRQLRPTLSILMSAGVCFTAKAAVKDYNGATGGSVAFSSAANYIGGVAPINDLTTDIVRFNLTSYTGLYQPTNGSYSLNGLIFGDGTNITADTALTINGGTGVQLKLGSGGIVINAHAGSVSINKIQLAADQTWINNSTNMFTVGSGTGNTIANAANITPVTLTFAGSGANILTKPVTDGGAVGTTAIKIAAGTTTLSAANTFTGGTVVEAGTLIGNANGCFGNGSVTVGAAGSAVIGTLTFNGAYMNDAAKLILRTNSILNLNFTGTDTIGGVSLDGGDTWLANGTYNAASFTAAGGAGTYLGAGSLNVYDPASDLHSGLVFQMMGSLDVYVCAGQSNMAGTTNSAFKSLLPVELQAAQTNVFEFDGTNWVVLIAPDTEFGPEISFAYEMQKTLKKPIGIVKYAKGGTGLALTWNPLPPPGAIEYQKLINKVNAARKARSINIKGMIWMQGEKDSGQTTYAVAYAQNLSNLIQTVRADFNAPAMPFVAGRVNPQPPPYPYSAPVRAAQENCTSTPYAWVNCDDLPKISDNVHYNTDGLVELGKRFAQSMQNLQ